MVFYRKENIKIERIRNIALSLGFLALLVFPNIQDYYAIIPESGTTENRQLAEKPTVNFNYLDAFPARYEKYYNDNFSLRNHLVNLRSLIIGKTFHVSPLRDKVIFGKDNWLFLVKNELDTYRGKNILKQYELDKIAKEMANRKDFLEKKNTSFYLVIAPTKYTVYPEFLPDHVDKINRITITDQVKEVLNSLEINVLDLRDTLINAKNDGLLYYKTDNHWNQLGAFIASKAIIEFIQKDYPNIPDLNLEDYNIKQELKNGGNTAQMIKMQDYFTDVNYILSPKITPAVKLLPDYGYPIPKYFPYEKEFELVYQTAADSLPNLLLIRDSFGNSTIPFIRQSFYKSIFIFDNWLYTSNEHIVENEKPDIVVYIVLESFWRGLLLGIDLPKDYVEK